MEETRAKSGEPIHLLDGMMPGMGSPEHIEMMLSSMDPIDHEIHDEQGHDNLDDAGHVLQVADQSGQSDGRNVSDAAPYDMRASAVYGEGKSERKDIQLEVMPTVNGSCGPNPFANLEGENKPKERGDLIIIRPKSHRI
jgi:hypothetical protein